MHPVLAAKHEAMAELCRRAGVTRLEVFGSAARDDFDEASSDIDLLVEFDATPRNATLAGFFDLKEALEALFARPVDLVMPSAVRNPYVRASIDRSRRLIYGA